MKTIRLSVFVALKLLEFNLRVIGTLLSMAAFGVLALGSPLAAGAVILVNRHRR